MKAQHQLLLMAVILTVSLTMYEGATPVTVLTSKNFDQVYKGVWLV